VSSLKFQIDYCCELSGTVLCVGILLPQVSLERYAIRGVLYSKYCSTVQGMLVFLTIGLTRASTGQALQKVSGALL